MSYLSNFESFNKMALIFFLTFMIKSYIINQSLLEMKYMVTITIQTNEEIVATLKKIAQSKHITTEALLQEAILSYLQAQTQSSGKYSFIGIGRSGKKNCRLG
ncbi:hypothetical protein JW964_28805 [candidate division KSB1 bacterium]|nr:hypothetical protein [candidate division KSB1 bacterium]